MIDAFFGTVILWSGYWTPENWTECDGKLLPIQRNQALFSLLGTRFGGDGTQNFAVPKLEAPAGMRYIICTQGIYPQHP